MLKYVLARVPFGRTIFAFARKMKGHGLIPWRPLVPEAEFSAAVRAAVRKVLSLEGPESFGGYLEFGVSRGTSTACVYRVLQEEGLQHARLFGFDSFEGLPSAAVQEGWTPGQYHSTLRATRRYLSSRGVDLNSLVLVKGWFKDSLTPETREKHGIGKASLILIDCDIYSASAEALAFCAPHIRDRCVIFFDDWGWKADKGAIGQKEAFEEFLTEHPDLIVEPLPAYRPEARGFLVQRRDSKAGLESGERPRHQYSI